MLNEHLTPSQRISLASRFRPQYGVLLDRLGRLCLIRLITLYQRYLSPHKGFSCAYRVLHNTHSCSQGVKAILWRYPLSTSLPQIRAQFQQCRQAARVLRDHRRHPTPFACGGSARNRVGSTANRSAKMR